MSVHTHTHTRQEGRQKAVRRNVRFYSLHPLLLQIQQEVRGLVVMAAVTMAAGTGNKHARDVRATVVIRRVDGVMATLLQFGSQCVRGKGF